jgi:peroxiredoxin
MKKIFFATLLIVSVLSCSGPDSIKIKGTVEGADEGVLVLKKLEVSAQRVVDSLDYKENGSFSANIDPGDETTPNFYYLYYNDNKIASLLLYPGDRVEVVTDTSGVNPRTSGSEESHMLSEVEKRLTQANIRFDSLMTLMTAATQSGDQERASELNYELGKLYVKQKQWAIKHVYEHPRAISNVLLLFHRFTPELPLFADVKDVLLLRRAHDSLSLVMPGSPYLQKIYAQIEEREKSELFNSKILAASQTGFPELKLPDTKAQERSLSALEGNVVLLTFWSVTEAEQRMLNQEYLSLYRKYNQRGFEIYQVSLDTDKTAWATTVKEQQLPWINVCDGLGAGSISVRTYNITGLPSNYLIDKEGNVVAKDIYGNELEREVSKLL